MIAGWVQVVCDKLKLEPHNSMVGISQARDKQSDSKDVARQVYRVF